MLDLIRIYDNGGKTADRYTAVYLFAPERGGCFEAFGFDENPSHPQGFGQHCSAAPGPHLGKRIKFETLPDAAQKALVQSIGCTPDELEEVTRGYLECALWADGPEDASPRYTRKAQRRAAHDCAAFIAACGPLFRQAVESVGYELERFGHDFWLTRCGHGAGFWDRDELDTPTICKTVQGWSRYDHTTGQKTCYNVSDNLGDALTDIAYGTDQKISQFAYPSLTVYRGWAHFD